MKHLKKFGNHMLDVKAQFENKHHNLIGEDLNTYNYVLGINDKVNEAFGGAIMDRLMKIAKNGVLTATVLTSLLNTPAFANEYKTLSSSEKTEIMKMVSTDDTSGSQQKVVDDGTLTINIGSSFKSGEYEISNDKDSKLMNELSKLQEFIKDTGDQNFKISIVASESQVPNKDAKTQERLGVGELSKLRAQSAEKLVRGYIESLGIKAGIAIDTDIKIGTEKWDGNNVRDARDVKYTAEQFVRIKIEVSQCPLCDFHREYQGAKAEANVDYVSYSKEFDVKDKIGTGRIKVTTGTIPDRAILVGNDGVIIADSGYVSDVTHRYVEYSLIPSYVSGLTQVLINTPNSDAIAGDQIKKVTVESFEELMGIMLKSEYNNSARYNVSKDLRKEIKRGLDELRNMFKNGQRTFVLYKEGKIELKYDLAKKYDTVEIKVFSPVDKTGFSLNISCSGK